MLNVAAAAIQKKQPMPHRVLPARPGRPMQAVGVTAALAGLLTRMSTAFRRAQAHPDRGWQACLLGVMAAWLGASLLVVLR
jgi:hypothetical protein